MTLFWISTVGLVVVAIALLAITLSSKKANNDEQLRDELNKAFYKDRLSELEVENEEGLVENQQDLIDDLKQSLLDDIPQQQQQTEKFNISPMAILIPSVALVVILTYGMYMHFGASTKVKNWQEVTANLPELSKKLMAGSAEPMTEDEMQDLTLALRTRLHYQKDDATGWLLLGRIALANRDVTTATDAMEKAYRLTPNDADVKLGYAQALMMSQDEMDNNRARSLLTSLIQEEYVDLRVFSLLAFDAFEREDFPGAIRYWSIMQKMIGPEDSRYEMLSRSIESAKARMGEPIVQGKSVAVTISLSPDARIPDDAALIVSVHPADGSPMPVAAARYPLGTFPRTVVLDDNNSMMEGRKLSSLDGLIVRVRIDSDGNVATRDGDWFGESQPAKLGDTVEVSINQQY
ncbi:MULTISPECIES: c-type cytochrome biogenesis protein CcmI [Vibrio]|uniref:c-type cytochrome biogenesis protein CcmI n=1 Tax=Vibrio TaxID=662 RepID=UPI0004DD42D1|nr:MULTISPECIES: c-type cytochrome biogenesis protein CcmI [Vibrio]KFA96515.1 cytochrome C heme lyase [Vibrio sp. ER1A]NOI22175.1 c-type cytochrome biogenesis protein CcmI [Vibrio mediterranei]